MKDRIYTIPVTDAFNVDCECPLCNLEKKLEVETVDYLLGGSLMESDGRIETNEHGFCRYHSEVMFNSRKNALGLGLILSTHLDELNEKISLAYESEKNENPNNKKFGRVSWGSKKNENKSDESELLKVIDAQQNNCTVCRRLTNNMNRYIGVVLYLWRTEKTFKELFSQKKGFCMKHFKALLEGSEVHLKEKQRKEFVDLLVPMQIENLKRLQEEVTWFTEKFDYRNEGKSWGNSKDSVQRVIEKLNGFSRLN